MWENFRHSRIHAELRSLKPLRMSIRTVKKYAHQLFRYWNLRTGRGLRQYISLESQRAHITGLVDYHTLFPAEDIIITPDRLPLLQHQNIVPLEQDRVRTMSVFWAVLQSAKVDMNSGATLSADDKLLITLDEYAKSVENHPTYGSVVPARPRFFEGNCTIIHSLASANYYHWLIDCLPSLYALKMFEQPINLLIPDTLTPKYRHILELCLPSNLKIVTTSLYLDRWIQAENLIYSSRVTSLHLPSLRPAHLNYLRSTLFDKLGLPDKHEQKHNIFISRKKAERRQITNDAAVQKLLQDCGFQSYVLEEMSFEEQVRLFHSAKVVVAGHGAGLSNVLFSGQISVLELASITATPTFALLTQLLGQNYDYLLPQQYSAHRDLPTQSDRRAHHRLNDTPITVDLQELKATLERIMARK